MNQKDVYQHDLAGRYLGIVKADESPREPGVWLMPARTVEIAPPEAWPDGTWPRWNGAAWEITGTGDPVAVTVDDPITKLAEFLHANPDVAALLV